MNGIRALAKRFPKRELDIRRRCACDNHFAAICGDYEEAATALWHWRQAAGSGDRRVEEYEQLLAELEAEILAKLARGTDRDRLASPAGERARLRLRSPGKAHD